MKITLDIYTSELYNIDMNTKEATQIFQNRTGIKVLSAKAGKGSVKALVSFTLPLNYEKTFNDRYLNGVSDINGVPFEFMRSVFTKVNGKFGEDPNKVQVDVYWQDLA